MPVAPEQRGFTRPHTRPPVAATYRMFSPSGLPKGHQPHYHPDTVEVCFVAHGRLDWWIEDEVYEIGSGDVLVIPPMAPHGSVDSTLQPCEYYAAHLIPEELTPSVAALVPTLARHYARIPATGDLVRQLFEEYRQDYGLLDETGAALVTLFLATLARQSHEGEAHEASRLVRRAQRALEHDDLTIEAAARGQGVTSVWLTRLFQRELGQSPGEWLRSRRLAEAKRLLAFGETSVTEIAIELGYASSQSFATAFRQQCGLTPTEYRARCAETWMGRAEAVCAPTR